eukprot:scaffold73692_cov106-Phaeocystis_antarctica.AAC.2
MCAMRSRHVQQQTGRNCVQVVRMGCPWQGGAGPHPSYHLHTAGAEPCLKRKEEGHRWRDASMGGCDLLSGRMHPPRTWLWRDKSADPNEKLKTSSASILLPRGRSSVWLTDWR